MRGIDGGRVIQLVKSLVLRALSHLKMGVLFQDAGHWQGATVYGIKNSFWKGMAGLCWLMLKLTPGLRCCSMFTFWHHFLHSCTPYLSSAS